MIRNIIEIDEELCTGCGKCVIGCPEGAIQLIEGIARLVAENYCDGLGACIGDCPVGAIKVIEREAKPYDEIRVLKNIMEKGRKTTLAHLKHLKEHDEVKLLNQALDYLKKQDFKNPSEYTHIEKNQEKCPREVPNKEKGDKDLEDIKFHGCPGSISLNLSQNKKTGEGPKNTSDPRDSERSTRNESQLRNWPIQIRLAPVEASYFKNADLLISADCFGSVYPNFHQDYVKGRTLLMGCPKLDDSQYYIQKFAQIFQKNSIKSIEITMMEVPCCNGLKFIIEKALSLSQKSGKIPVKTSIVNIKGKEKKNQG